MAGPEVIDPGASDFPDLPTFDDRALRGAVRRALTRTVVTVLVVLLLGNLGWKVVKAGVDAALGRPSINEALTILQLGHPDMVVRQGSMSQDRLTASLTPVTPTGQGGGTNLFTVTRSIFGTLHFDGNFGTEQGPLVDALAGFGHRTVPGKQTQTAAIRSLPANVALVVVVRFTAPLSPERAYEHFQPTGTPTAQLLFSDAPSSRSSLAAFPVSWGFGNFSDDSRDAQNGGIFTEYLRQLRAWVADHRTASAHQWDLEGVDMDRVRAAAKAGQVHGVVATNVTTVEALKLLTDPAVGQVTVTNVELIPPVS